MSGADRHLDELAATMGLLAGPVRHAATLPGVTDDLAEVLVRTGDELAAAHLRYRRAGRPETTTGALVRTAGDSVIRLRAAEVLVRDPATALVLRDLRDQLDAHRAAVLKSS